MKKKADVLEEAKKMVYSAEGKIARREFLDYIWNYCIMPQAG